MGEPVFLGVEGGGSKARAIVEHNGRTAAKLEWNGLNPCDITCEEFEVRLRSLVAPLLGPLRGSRTPIYAYFALAGAGKPVVRHKCRTAIVRALRVYGTCRRIKVTTDAAALIEKYLEDRDGIILIAGTGSICMAVRRVGGRRRSARVGGKGGSLDEGSGYWIGSRLIQHVLGAPGRAGGRSRCAALLLRNHGISASDAGSEFRGWERSRVASLAPIVLWGYDRRDEFARLVIARAVSDLVGMVVAATEKVGLQGKTGLYLAGGLFQSDAFERLFRQRLRQVLPGLAPHVSADDLTALLLLAKRLARARRPRSIRSVASRPL
jgi:N-acetylglucosamine kinase-like BadF-type ATPase